MPFTTPYVKYAFSPMPGAIATGYRAIAPIRMLAKPADRHVAVITAPTGMPASARIDGLTKMMYAIVRNVVKPAAISRAQDVPSSSNEKYRSAARFI